MYLARRVTGQRLRVYLIRGIQLDGEECGQFKPRPDSLLVQNGLSGDGFFAIGDTQSRAIERLHDLEMLHASDT